MFLEVGCGDMVDNVIPAHVRRIAVFRRYFTLTASDSAFTAFTVVAPLFATINPTNGALEDSPCSTMEALPERGGSDTVIVIVDDVCSELSGAPNNLWSGVSAADDTKEQLGLNDGVSWVQPNTNVSPARDPYRSWSGS